MSDPIIKNVDAYLAAVSEIATRASNIVSIDSELGSTHYIAAHIDREKGELVIGIFKQKNRFIIGFQTLGMK